jgi:hypothetical protein
LSRYFITNVNSEAKNAPLRRVLCKILLDQSLATSAHRAQATSSALGVKKTDS